MSLIYDEGRFWFLDREGVRQRIDNGAEQDLAALVDLFRIRFGRDPGPGDPLLFDPRLDEPTPLSREDVKVATADLLRGMDAHPAYQFAHAQLGYLITSENARYARAEDVARWGQVISEWQLANPQAPPLVSLVIGAVRERPRATPESAAVQEALAHADRASTEKEKLVVAIVCARHPEHRRGRRRIVVVYYPDFVRAAEQAGNGADFDGEYVLEDATPAAFARYLARGWVPVAVACGDDSPTATFVTVRAGIHLTRAGEKEVVEHAMREISALIARIQE